MTEHKSIVKCVYHGWTAEILNGKSYLVLTEYFAVFYYWELIIATLGPGRSYGYPFSNRCTFV